MRLDPRDGVLRVPAGRTPSNLAYTLTLPAYPTADALGQVPAVTRDKSLLAAPPVPAAVQKIMVALNKLCEPALRPIRKFLPDLGGIDISPIILLLLLNFLRSALYSYFYNL